MVWVILRKKSKAGRMNKEIRNTDINIYYKAKMLQQCSNKMLNKYSHATEQRAQNRPVHIW